MIGTQDYNAAMAAPSRMAVILISIYDENDELVERLFPIRMLSPNDDDVSIKNVEITKTGGNNKFFGAVIKSRLNFHIVDIKKTRHYPTNYYCVVEQYAVDTMGYTITGSVTSQKFYITEQTRDEKTGELSITAYDVLGNDEVYESALTAPYTVLQLGMEIASKYGVQPYLVNIDEDDEFLLTSLPNGANLDGNQKLSEVIEDFCEATFSICYIDNQNRLVLKRLNRDGNPDFTIDKANYFEAKSNENRRLKEIVKTNELGDNISASIAASGSTQFIRDNCIFEKLEDTTVASLLDDAIEMLGGTTIAQFNCKWRGNCGIEAGDKIQIETTLNGAETQTYITSYFLDDKVTYSGGLVEDTQYRFEEDKNETASNPTTIGELMKTTVAKVDKAEQKIILAISKSEEYESRIASLETNTDGIIATVGDMQKNIEETAENLQDNITEIENQVNAKITSTDAQLIISEALANGVTKVDTQTGFVFDKDGLTIDKSTSEMKTQITEDGMTVYRNEEEMLKANNNGVDAVNLHAKTYLIIGDNTRFENYGYNRTGCFYIGG